MRHANESEVPVPRHADAFVGRFVIEPSPGGPLHGTSFAVKDVFDVAGWPTGCGNPTWRATHSAPKVSAAVVEQLLRAGARLVGKTCTDELAYSLDGRNFHDGAPINPAAPERLTGGSSSGAASAVAAKEIDFAVATLARVAGMVSGAGEAIFAVARTAGWIAHALEAYAGGGPLRPRAVYTGPPAIIDP